LAGHSWLADFAGARLCDIHAIPASHNSTCVHAGRFCDRVFFPFARTQRLSVPDQLLLGVRLLDVRISDGDRQRTVFTSHTFLTDVSFASVLTSVVEFLRKYPTEFVVLYVRKDHARPLDVKATARELLCVPLENFADATALSVASRVADLAGRIVFVSDVVSVADGFPMNLIWRRDDVLGGVCDVWRCRTAAEAKCRVERHLRGGGLSQMKSQMRAVALDGSFGMRTPFFSAMLLRDWFLDLVTGRYATNDQPIGFVLFDYVDEEICGTLIGLSQRTRLAQKFPEAP